MKLETRQNTDETVCGKGCGLYISIILCVNLVGTGVQEPLKLYLTICGSWLGTKGDSAFACGCACNVVPEICHIGQ